MKNNDPLNTPENPRRKFLKTAATGSIAALSLSGLAVNAFASDKNTDKTEKEEQPIEPDHLIRSTAENTVYGYYGFDVPPIAHVKDGDVVAIQTVNTTGPNRRDRFNADSRRRHGRGPDLHVRHADERTAVAAAARQLVRPGAVGRIPEPAD